jgi:hypothetical protein
MSVKYARYQRIAERLGREARREARFALERLRYQLSHATAGVSTRMLLLSDLQACTSETQFDPFFAHRDALRKELGVVFRHQRLADAMRSPAEALADFDVIGLKLGFRTDPGQAHEIVRTLSSVKGRAKLVYFDGDDDSTVQWPELLPWVDLYVKKHMFRDPAMYEKRFIGRNNLTDHVARTYGVSFADDMMPASKPVDVRYLDRVKLGYNLASDNKIVEIYRRTRGMWRRAHRPNDVVCRAQLSGWLAYLRRDVGTLLSQLPAQYCYLTPTRRVSQQQYDEELHASKICVSPFGFGELCWRDFEAVLWGCLMMKPDMSHIRTKPDIFVPYETYVPLKWDMSDLPEKCLHYLEHPRERLRITENAYRVLEHYYESTAFIGELGDLLTQLDSQASVDRT